jgi:RNA polymerase sigma factor (sigma-70 family)
MASEHLGAALRQIHLLFGEGTLAGLSDLQLLERYVSHRDESAFEVLVQRHGSMVLAVCRGVLDDPNDAEDAFQATFLLLARKAGSLWVKDSLGGWLHRVAWRIAYQVKAETVRRRGRERKAAERAGPRSTSTPSWDDTQVVLHQEIDRLPERYRVPLVLCYLEDMTYQQAARHLSWSEATTQGRLARARNLLRSRLTRRGVTLAGVTIGALAGPGRAAALSSEMLRAAVKTAHCFHLGATAPGELVSSTAYSFMTRALRTMMIANLKWVGAAALVIGGLTSVATGLAAHDDPTAEVHDRGRGTPEPQVPPAGRRGMLKSPAPRSAPVTSQMPKSPAPRSAPVTSEVIRSGDGVNISMDLLPGRRLERGDSLFSPLGGFRLYMRHDGNLVLYAIDDTRLPKDLSLVLSHAPEVLHMYTEEIWSTGTDVPGDEAGVGSYCIMQPDGDFVVYDEAGKRCFSSNTAGYPGAYLRCQDDGNVVIHAHDPDLRPIWDTCTFARFDEAKSP